MGSDVVRQQLDDIFKQMLLVFAKESTALKQISGKRCGRANILQLFSKSFPRSFDEVFEVHFSNKN